MKKSVIIILMVLLIVFTTACNHTSGVNESHNSSPSAAASEHPNNSTVTDKTADPSTEAPSPDEDEPEVIEPGVAETVHAHSFEKVDTAPTCTDEGYATYTCACGDSYVSDKAPALGHKFGEWETTKEPTETETGLSQRKCSACDITETKTLGKVVADHTHSYTSKITTNATCVQEGTKTYTCSCGETYTESIARVNHNYKTTQISATCTTDGYIRYSCSLCNDTYMDGRVNALGHDYADTVVTPTCTKGGYTKHTCTRCGTSYNDSVTNAIEHSYENSVIKPTCVANGYTKHVCSGCGTSYTDTVTNATGHTYAFTSDTATCTSNGTKTETCTQCGDKKTSATSALGHNIEKETLEATCTTDGYVKEACTKCGTVVSNTTIAATGNHEYTTRIVSEVASEYVNAGGYHYVEYLAYKDWCIDVCKKCGDCDFSKMRFRYTAYEAAVIMLGYVNDLRAEVYGTHDYDLVLDDTLLEWAQERAVAITINYSHSGRPLSCGENICSGGLGIYDHFIRWKNSEGHYANMIRKDYKYFGYALCNATPNTIYANPYGVQLFKK